MNPIGKALYRMNEAKWNEKPPEELWHLILTAEDPLLRQFRLLFKHIPSAPRCKFCNAPFHGLGAPLMRFFGREPSQLNPRFCSVCLDPAPLGGAEIELTLLFADVRGSMSLAEQMSPADFSRLISRFFTTSTRVLIQANAWIDRLVGDEVIALFLPGYVGTDHQRVAVEAAIELLRETGHHSSEGPWIPVGVGVHSGKAFVGKVGHAGVSDITVLGDVPNVAARLASQSAAGEILVSDDTFKTAGMGILEPEVRQLQLKGRTQPMAVRVLQVTPVYVN